MGMNTGKLVKLVEEENTVVETTEIADDTLLIEKVEGEDLFADYNYGLYKDNYNKPVVSYKSISGIHMKDVKGILKKMETDLKKGLSKKKLDIKLELDSNDIEFSGSDGVFMLVKVKGDLSALKKSVKIQNVWDAWS